MLSSYSLSVAITVGCLNGNTGKLAWERLLHLYLFYLFIGTMVTRNILTIVVIVVKCEIIVEMRQIEYIFVKTRGGNCLLLPTCSYGPTLLRSMAFNLYLNVVVLLERTISVGREFQIGIIWLEKDLCVLVLVMIEKNRFMCIGFCNRNWKFERMATEVIVGIINVIIIIIIIIILQP